MDSLFRKFFQVIPTVKAQEEDLVDPQGVLREECDSHCTALKEKYEACNARVRSKKMTTETCSEELIDFLHCVDHCVTPRLFPKLK